MSFDLYNMPLKVRDSNSQSGSSLGSVGVHSLTLSYTPESMKCNSWASLLACTFTSPYLNCEPKAKIMTVTFQESLLLVIKGTLGKNKFLQCLKMFKIFVIFLQYMGSPLPFGWSHTWVVPLKTTHPKITGIIGFILINERKIFKK